MQLQKNEREILKLRAEKERLQNMNSGNLTADDLLRKIRERESEISDITREYDQVYASFSKNEKIFVDSKAYQEELLKQIHEKKLKN